MERFLDSPFHSPCTNYRQFHSNHKNLVTPPSIVLDVFVVEEWAGKWRQSADVIPTNLRSILQETDRVSGIDALVVKRSISLDNIQWLFGHLYLKKAGLAPKPHAPFYSYFE